jgi:hypothetical protein
MAIVYIDKCRYEIQEQKKSSGMVYQHLPAHFEHYPHPEVHASE